MKINTSSSKKDFFIFYFSQVFLKKQTYGDKIYNFTKVFNIPKEKIRSLEISNDEKALLFNGENLKKWQEYNFIYNFYKEIPKQNISILIKELDLIINTYINFLEKLFGKNESLKELNIAFIQAPLAGATVELDAFTSKTLENKIYISLDKDFILNKEKIDYHLKVLLHEFTHIFINNNTHFQKVMKNEWEKYYKNTKIKADDYRLNIEELLVSSLILPAKDFGFVYKGLGFKENEKNKKESLEKNRFRKITLSFLETLEKKNNLEKSLPVFIKELIQEGMFN